MLSKDSREYAYAQACAASLLPLTVADGSATMLRGNIGICCVARHIGAFLWCRHVCGVFASCSLDLEVDTVLLLNIASVKARLL